MKNKRAGIWAWYLWRAILEMLDVGCWILNGE